MNPIEIRFTIKEYKADELDKNEKELIKLAREAARKAYAPYSTFRVGAALITEDGQVFTGNNQENAAFPAGMCAERVALNYAMAQDPENKIIALAIVALRGDTFTESPVYPCGSCRQVLTETEIRQNGPIELIMAGEKRIQITEKVSNLLPLNFSGEFLK